ncbi:hypothetical protein Aperf_G00000016078 [Anoplocephala perfoliata]
MAFSHDLNDFFDSEETSNFDFGSYSLDDSASGDADPYPKGQEYSSKWVRNGDFGNGEEAPAQPNMMDTFEKLKRQAVKTVVPGDEAVTLTESSSSFSRLNSLVSWQTATLISVLCVGAVIVGVVLGVLYWPKAAFGERRNSSEETKKGLIESSIERAGDRSLAHSAQMYHYQQQKQQMLAMEQAAGRDRNLDSNSDSEDECEEPDVNVYECPGLASASEMEVKNPLFEERQDENSGVSSAKNYK